VKEEELARLGYEEMKIREEIKISEAEFEHAQQEKK
jgi:hypothetical protein